MQRKEELLGSKDTAIPPQEKAIPLPIMMGKETAPISWGKCRLKMEKTPTRFSGGLCLTWYHLSSLHMENLKHDVALWTTLTAREM